MVLSTPYDTIYYYDTHIRGTRRVRTCTPSAHRLGPVFIHIIIMYALCLCTHTHTRVYYKIVYLRILRDTRARASNNNII